MITFGFFCLKMCFLNSKLENGIVDQSPFSAIMVAEYVSLHKEGMYVRLEEGSWGGDGVS